MHPVPQMIDPLAVIIAGGSGLTVTITVAVVHTQPFASVIVHV